MHSVPFFQVGSLLHRTDFGAPTVVAAGSYARMMRVHMWCVSMSLSHRPSSDYQNIRSSLDSPFNVFVFLPTFYFFSQSSLITKSNPTAMSNPTEREAEDFYESQNDPSPVSGRFKDDTYTGEPRQALKDRIPVQRDEDVEESPIQPPFSNTEDQLGRVHLPAKSCKQS